MSVLVVPPGSEGIRLDLFVLRHTPPGTTRGAIQRAIRRGTVSLAGKSVVKPSTTVHSGQVVSFREIAADRREDHPARPLPPLVILHEDPAFLVVDKPAGVPVHAGVKKEPTLADALLARYPKLRDVGLDPARAGLVHRLDKDTSGVLLAARNPDSYAYLQEQFRARKVVKEYRVLVVGTVREDFGSVKLPIVRSARNPLRRVVVQKKDERALNAGRGKAAETDFRVLERLREHTLLAVFPRTGRMHQIRVHLAHLGHPVAGDALYGRRAHARTPPGLTRQFLHSSALTVTLPSGRRKTFVSPLPRDLAGVLDALRASAGRPHAAPLTYRWRAPRAPRR